MATVAPSDSDLPRSSLRLRGVLATRRMESRSVADDDDDELSRPPSLRAQIARTSLRLLFFSIFPLLIVTMLVNEVETVEYLHVSRPVRVAKTTAGTSFALNLCCTVVVCWQLSLFIQANHRGRTIRYFSKLDVVELVLNIGLLLPMCWFFGLPWVWSASASITIPPVFIYYMKRLVYNVYTYQGGGKRYYTWLIARVPGAAMVLLFQFVWSVLAFAIGLSTQPPPTYDSVLDDPLCASNVSSCSVAAFSVRGARQLVQTSAISCASKDSWAEALTSIGCPANATELCVFTSWQAACKYAYIYPILEHHGLSSWAVNVHLTVTYLFVFFPLFHAGRISYTKGANGEDDGQYDLTVFTRSPHLVVALALVLVATLIALLMVIWMISVFPMLTQVQPRPSPPTCSAVRDEQSARVRKHVLEEALRHSCPTPRRPIRFIRPSAPTAIQGSVTAISHHPHAPCRDGCAEMALPSTKSSGGSGARPSSYSMWMCS